MEGEWREPTQSGVEVGETSDLFKVTLQFYKAERGQRLENEMESREIIIGVRHLSLQKHTRGDV